MRSSVVLVGTIRSSVYLAVGILPLVLCPAVILILFAETGDHLKTSISHP